MTSQDVAFVVGTVFVLGMMAYMVGLVLKAYLASRKPVDDKFKYVDYMQALLWLQCKFCGAKLDWKLGGDDVHPSWTAECCSHRRTMYPHTVKIEVDEIWSTEDR